MSACLLVELTSGPQGVLEFSHVISKLLREEHLQHMVTDRLHCLLDEVVILFLGLLLYGVGIPYVRVLQPSLLSRCR